MIKIARDSQFAPTLISTVGGMEAKDGYGNEIVIAGVGRTLDTWRIHDNARGITFFCAAVLLPDNESIVSLAYHVTSKTRMVGTATRLTRLAEATVDAPRPLREATIALAVGHGVASLWNDHTQTRIASLIFRKGDRIRQPETATHELPKISEETRYSAYGLYYKKGDKKMDWVLVRQITNNKQVQLWKVAPADILNATMPAGLQQLTDAMTAMFYTHGISYLLGRPIPVTYLLAKQALFAAPTPPLSKVKTRDTKANEQAIATSDASSGATVDATASGGTVGADTHGDDETDAVGETSATLPLGDRVHL